MDIILRGIRHVEIDDMPDVRDVNAARRDVGRHQDPVRAALKALQGGPPLREATIAMDDGHLMASAPQGSHETIGAMLGPGEDQDGLLILC